MILHTGEVGTTLSSIIKSFGDKSYKLIECRVRWADEHNTPQDDLFGYCSYDAETGDLTALDGDGYSLNDLYTYWDERKEDDGSYVLTVWEEGRLSYD